jgi:pimeloyl-ACP methyl ester carboxylesterase
MPTLTRDGVALSFEQSTGGTPPVVLVHGLGCDRSFMAPQFEALSGQHRVVAVDLRGHGRSSKPEQAYTITGFADDLRWVLDELAAERPVVVGHSMGGLVALELAARQPERLAGIVMLDSAVLPPPHVHTSVRAVIAALKTADYRAVGRSFFANAFFLPTDDEQRKEAIVAAMVATPQHVMASAFEGIFAWDGASAAERCTVPLLYIGSTQPRGDITRLGELCSTVVQGQIVGSGHFLQLEVPDQVNAMIRRFLAIYVD